MRDTEVYSWMVQYKLRFGMPLGLAEMAEASYAEEQLKAPVRPRPRYAGDLVFAEAGAAVQEARQAAAAASAKGTLAAQAARAAAQEAMRAADEARATVYSQLEQGQDGELWQPLERVPSWMVLPARRHS